MTAGRTNHTRFAAAPERDPYDVRIGDRVRFPWADGGYAEGVVINLGKTPLPPHAAAYVVRIERRVRQIGIDEFAPYTYTERFPIVWTLINTPTRKRVVRV